MTEHTDEQLLAMAMANLGEYMHDNSPHYVLIEDPRNEDDFDTWSYGTEPLPNDHTWRSASVDVDVTTLEQNNDSQFYFFNTLIAKVEMWRNR
jgi:hypothetical protein